MPELVDRLSAHVERLGFDREQAVAASRAATGEEKVFWRANLEPVRDAARSRLVIAEGVSSVGKRKRNGLTDQFVGQLWPDPPQDLEEALREEIELDGLLVEALGDQSPSDGSPEDAGLSGDARTVVPGADETLAEAPEVGKPGTNWKQVTPENRKKINPIVKHYMKKAHPFSACFTADTPVDTPRDMERYPEGVPISAVRGGDLVWSYDQAARAFVLKPVIWSEVTRRDAELVAVGLDTGRVIRCTPDHRFLLRDGRWITASRLRPGDSLMPLYRDFTPRVRLRPDALGFTDEHDVVAETLHGPLDGRHVHHVDQRRVNAAPDNLRALTGREHTEAHHREFAEAVALRDERWLCPSCEELYTPTRRNQRRCDPCQALRSYQKDFVGKQARCDRVGCEVEYEVRSPNHRYCSARCRTLARQGRRAVGEVSELRGMHPAVWNHKVASVVSLPEREDVWDLEVADTHTFVVQGVVVHNCVRDNRKRFGPRAEKVCAVVKDMGEETTKWRKGGKKVKEAVATEDEYLEAQFEEFGRRMEDAGVTPDEVMTWADELPAEEISEANPYELSEETAVAEPDATELTLKPGDGAAPEPQPAAGDERVKHLQTRLGQLGHQVNPDGVYGDKTKTAVAAFQAKAGLLGTGEVDEVTVKALRSAKDVPEGGTGGSSKPAEKSKPKAAAASAGSKAGSAPTRPSSDKSGAGRADELAQTAIGVLRRGEGSQEASALVKQVQDVLQRKGYDPGPPDGRYGRDTETAVRAFQREHGLRADGKVGRHTKRMLDLLQEAQEKDRLETTIEEALRGLHVPFNPALHPRGRAGRFAESFGRITGPKSRPGGWNPPRGVSRERLEREQVRGLRTLDGLLGEERSRRNRTRTDAKLPTPAKAGPDRLPRGSTVTGPRSHHGARLTDVHVRHWSTPHLEKGASVFKPGTSAHEAVQNEMARRGKAGPTKVRTIKPPRATKSPPTKGPDKLPRGRVRRQGLPPTTSKPPDRHPHTGTKSPGKTGPRSSDKPRVSAVYHDPRGRSTPWSLTLTDGKQAQTQRYKDPEAARKARAAIQRALGPGSPGVRRRPTKAPRGASAAKEKVYGGAAEGLRSAPDDVLGRIIRGKASGRALHTRAENEAFERAAQAELVRRAEHRRRVREGIENPSFRAGQAAGAAILGVVNWDPQKHPRNATGEFARVLADTDGTVRLPSGVTVRSGWLGGYVVKGRDGKRRHVHTEAEAATLALKANAGGGTLAASSKRPEHDDYLNWSERGRRIAGTTDQPDQFWTERARRIAHREY